MKTVLHIQEGDLTPWNEHQKAFEISVANFALSFFLRFLAPAIQQDLPQLRRIRGRLLPVPTAVGRDGNGETLRRCLSLLVA